jgi:hypothetical protein
MSCDQQFGRKHARFTLITVRFTKRFSSNATFEATADNVLLRERLDRGLRLHLGNLPSPCWL